MNIKKYRFGFTLVEVLVVIGIISILAAVVLVAVNPTRQFKLARDSQRNANLSAIVNAIHENMSEHRGIFTCSGSIRTLPSVPLVIKRGEGYPAYAGDIAECLVPDYLPSLPFDPSKPGARYVGPSDYDTGYEISQDQTGRITASSTGELSTSISVTR